MSHATVLDCGCYIAVGGGRTWCPTCANGGPSPKAEHGRTRSAASRSGCTSDHQSLGAELRAIAWVLREYAKGMRRGDTITSYDIEGEAARLESLFVNVPAGYAEDSARLDYLDKVAHAVSVPGGKDMWKVTLVVPESDETDLRKIVDAARAPSRTTKP